MIEDLDHVKPRRRGPWAMVLKIQDVGLNGELDPVYFRCRYCKKEFPTVAERVKHEPPCYAKLHQKEIKERSAKKE